LVGQGESQYGRRSQALTSCKLTHGRPNNADTAALAAFAAAEKAKRRLVVELMELKLPIINRDQDPEYGLAFDLLSSEVGKSSPATTTASSHWISPRVTTCTARSCGSRWTSRTAPCSGTCATRSGTTTSTAWSASRRTTCRGSVHCSATPTPTTRRHPAEDWAETFAQYLHIRDTLDTSAGFGFTASSTTFERRMLGPNGFDTIIEMWLPLAWALNMVNRSMGRDDLYPFVLPEPVLEKMRFIRTTIDEIASNPAKLASAGTA